jgi:hypothetical protein
MIIYLYNESKNKSLHLQEIKEYLEDKLLAEVSLKKRLLREELAPELARIRVLDVYKPFSPNEPLPGEIGFEERVIRGEALPLGVLYDGLRLQELYWRVLPRGKRSLDTMHVVFTDRFFGTFDEGDLRYHGRVILLGYPTVISPTGLVEAPAKPREYYIARRFKISEEELQERFKGRFLDYEDERMTEVLKGYVMQGVFYHFLGEAFCPELKCRLYNAHWQEEVLKAQLSLPEFCEKHEGMLGKNIKCHAKPNLKR